MQRDIQQHSASAESVLFLILLAGVFWWIVFASGWVNFWLGMSVATATLTILSYLLGGSPLRRVPLGRTLGLGLISAGVLYGIFAIGFLISRWMFQFAPGQVGDVYTIRNAANPALIAAVLLCVTSPCEELFWRGFLQRWMTKRFGLMLGWVVSSLIYAGVHIASGNFMLTMAALVAGAFWGGLYTLTGNLWACILSHAIWTVLIFLICPVA